MTKALSVPVACDICSARIEDEFYDARLPGGPWANCCPACFQAFRLRLGTGLGQKFQGSRSEGFFKVEG